MARYGKPDAINLFVFADESFVAFERAALGIKVSQGEVKAGKVNRPKKRCDELVMAEDIGVSFHATLRSERQQNCR